MRVLPILFNTDMVRAILENRKTVTRRAVKPAPTGSGEPAELFITRPGFWNTWGDDMVYRQPYRPGDILYVRETWYKDAGRYMYRANYSESEKFYRNGKEVVIKWRPSIHMPKEAARLFLRVTGVRVERLRDMTDEQAFSEGVPDDCDYPLESCDTPRNRFFNLWDSLIKPADHDRYGWAANPWVWVIEFERISKEVALKGGDEG